MSLPHSGEGPASRAPLPAERYWGSWGSPFTGSCHSWADLRQAHSPAHPYDLRFPLTPPKQKQANARATTTA